MTRKRARMEWERLLENRAQDVRGRNEVNKQDSRGNRGLAACSRSLTPPTRGPKWRALAASRRGVAFGGAVAQLGERLVRNEEVRGSTPLGSTTRLKPKQPVQLLGRDL